MKIFFIAALVLSSYVLARQSIREGEQSGIPDRADVEKDLKTDTKEIKDRKKEVRENQEETDPVFYDSTTSPGEMEEKNRNDF